MGSPSIENAKNSAPTLAECGRLFFSDPHAPSVLPTANACSHISIDRFVLSCPVSQKDYANLWSHFLEVLKAKPLRCKRNRIRGLRRKVTIRDVPSAALAAAQSQIAPQTTASVEVDLQIYHGRHGHYFGVQGNGRFTPYQWQCFHKLLTTHFPLPQAVRVSRVEVPCDFPLDIHYVAVLPIGSKHRFCLQGNGFYYGARPSDNSLACYDNSPDLLSGTWTPRTRVEARIRARVEVGALVDECLPFLNRFGIYVASEPLSMLFLPDAWRAADTRGRKRFLAHVEPFRLRVDEQRARLALEEFAKAVLPPAFAVSGTQLLFV